MANVTLLASSLTKVLDADLYDSDGVTKLASAGDRIVLVPVTTWRAVMVGQQSLEDAWGSLSKTNHTHAGYETALADYQAELIRATDRITALEGASQSS